MDGRGLVLLLIGVALVAVSILADDLGIGGEPGFGWKQGVGVGVGGALILLGAALGLYLGRSGGRDRIEL